MNSSLEFETYLSISSNKFEIFLLEIKKLKNLYQQDLELKNDIENIDLSILSKFLDDNIFKIEKLAGTFINDISIIVDNTKILKTNLSIKKKNYSINVKDSFLENALTDIKDLFQENYKKNKLMHMIINKYLVNGINHPLHLTHENIKDICLEVKLISISNEFTIEIDKILKKYQVHANNYLDRNYIKSFFKDENLELSVKAYKLKNGINRNEVKIVSKYFKNKGIFEKFFQLFS